LRKYLLSNFAFDEIVFLGKDVFHAAVDTIIFLLQTGKATAQINFIEGNTLIENKPLSNDKVIGIESISKTDFIIPITQDKTSSELLTKLNKDCVPLDSIGNWSDGVKIVGKAKDFAFQETKVDESFFPMYSGGDIERYKLSWSGLYCCRDKQKIIKHNATDIRLRDEDVFNKPKIIIRKTGNKIIASIDEKKYYYEQSLFSFSLNDNSIDLKFLLAILNSKVGNYLLKGTSFSKKDTFPQIRLHWLKEFPIKLNSEGSLKNKIIELVESIQNLKKEIDKEKLQTKIEQIKSKTDYIEEKVDEAVYKLYNLTPDEIKIVEGK
jgi:hypothetical protein